jgi:hypothetical protein
VIAAVGVSAVLVLGALTLTGSAQGGGAPAVAAAKLPAAEQPWPEASVLESRRKEAESRALFAADAPLEFTLTADFKTVNKDRDVESTKVFPATMTVAKADGTPATFTLNIRTRGHVRRMARTCSFAPLRLEFQADQVKGTVFEGHKNIKLGTHCRDNDLFEQYVPREYTAYRIYNLFTPRSFRARLAKATYVDSTSKQPIGTRMALFVEDDDDVARRLGGRAIDTQKLAFRRVDWDTVTMLSLFEYVIGNTDLSLFALHNVVLVQTPNGPIYPVPYDFDYSGLVNARYAIPAKQFNLASVQERFYMGPCRTAPELDGFFKPMLEKKAEVMKLLDTVPGLDAGYRKEGQKYLDGAFQTMAKPGDVKRVFIDTCNNRPGM